MEISLIDPAWLDRFLEQYEGKELSEESAKELYSRRNESGEIVNYITSEKTAIIPVLGPLTKTKDLFYWFFAGNNTTYEEIIKGVQAAGSNDKIENIKLQIDSPGGNWIGMTEAVQAIASVKKPVFAEIIGMATSAAYILAAQADKITSTTDANEVGGLGVQTRVFNEENSKIVRSSNAEKKNPDAFTKSGEKELVRQLDAVESKAIKMVSDGRTAATGKNISEKVVKKDFGRGASMLADESLNRNMIDEITPAPVRVSNAQPAANSGKGRKLESKHGSDINLNKGKNMDIKLVSELKAEYPTLCAELVKEAMAAGRAELQDQVNGHILMGESSGAHELCMKNLKEGNAFGSAEVQAGYMSAGMKKKDLKNREGDNPDGDLGGDDDKELSEEAKEKELVAKALDSSNKPVHKEV